jgi:hypothetical protein
MTTASIHPVLAAFPDFDGAVLDIAPLQPEPWHKDLCPKYRAPLPGGCVELWTDFADPALRDVGGEQYTLTACNERYELLWQCAAETLDGLRAVAGQWLAEQTGQTPPAAMPLGELLARAAAAALAVEVPVREIGIAFLAVLRQWLSDDQYAQLTDPANDLTLADQFCDANMAMDTAFRQVMGRAPCLTSDSDEGDATEAQVDADLELMCLAWDVARARSRIRRP